jgi:hypothetical protein
MMGRHARTRSILSATALLTVVAMGSAFAASTRDDPDEPVSSGPITGPPPGDGLPQIVEPEAGLADVFARPFDTATASGDATSVTIDFWSGVEPCTMLDHVDATYGPRTVTITLFEGRDPNAGDVACIEIAVAKRVVVRLDEPLGDRPIVDGAA